MSELNPMTEPQKQTPLNPTQVPQMSGGEPDEAPAEPRQDEPEWKVPGNDTMPGVENVPANPPEKEPTATPERRWL
jgi:hypothetical protein